MYMTPWFNNDMTASEFANATNFVNIHRGVRLLITWELSSLWMFGLESVIQQTLKNQMCMYS